jgi:hypothetical protein
METHGPEGFLLQKQECRAGGAQAQGGKANVPLQRVRDFARAQSGGSHGPQPRIFRHSFRMIRMHVSLIYRAYGRRMLQYMQFK